MKNMMQGLIAVLLISIMSGAVAYSGRTVEESGLSGSWWPRRNLDEVVTEISKMKPTEITLQVSPKNQARITRAYPDGSIETTESISFQQVGSLFYWKFRREDGLEYQLVLGGWKLKGRRSILFGHLYLANSKHGLFNGWPVTVQLTNKGTEHDNTAPVL
ncbi:hypothetical protein [Microbulbifer hydrolyticus]|uniref:Uncharacterized protein n=1 Tax=Microbulbifer hydrolyticus TaxID=48074 RepID=A0A6P1TEY9_9GAMM|nr:hypothetical protein [Microbulbifer hydrolyticus]MBB5212628.1 hypothetical protein [Microbulbifer hydrolyticus]QHQ40233.1 hypothetical protein GTQ55_15435 [Microbulbifer hydrolyticus]